MRPGMHLIRFTTSVAPYNAGETGAFPLRVCESYIDRGKATWVVPPKERAEAVSEDSETATPTPSRPKLSANPAEETDAGQDNTENVNEEYDPNSDPLLVLRTMDWFRLRAVVKEVTGESPGNKKDARRLMRERRDQFVRYVEQRGV